MENDLFRFNPGTNTCLAPIPTSFEHVLKFITKSEQFLTIHNQEDITNVNSLLEQTLNLQVSNIIQRVIAQVIGEYRDGFVTIKATEDGALHVYDTKEPAAGPTVKRADISQHTIANVQVIGLVALKKLCIVNIVFTVDAEADIYLNSDDHHMSGAMDFGGTNEPKGFVSNHGMFPLKTLEGEAFKIESNTVAWIKGYVVYYEE